MFKRRTSKVRRRPQVLVLKARVMSPRIAWYSFLRLGGRLLKWSFGLAVFAALVWGAWTGGRQWLVENEEFQLQAIELTPNSAIDEKRFVLLTGINLSGSLFECDVTDIEDRLRVLPELASVDVKRRFPGTLVVDVVAREPQVWVASPSQGVPPRDYEKGLLVDRSGVAYPCPPGQREIAASLPVIVLGEGGQPLVAGRKVDHPEFQRALRLHEKICRSVPEAAGWIDTIRQSRPWALEVTARDGMTAVFGLGDHDRQVSDLLAAVDHSRRRGQLIDTINLIPERNLPVTLRGERAPRAILVPEPEETAPAGQREQDLRKLLNRR